MKVGITQRITHVEKGAPRDNLEEDYVEYYTKFGITLVPIPNVLKNVADYIRDLKLERIILSGGGEMNQTARNKTEKAIIIHAIHNNMPLLCECRGFEFLNLHFGGRLLNIKQETGSLIEHVGTKHPVNITDEKVKTYFGTEHVIVNSYHNNGFTKKALANDLNAFAVAPDGIVEAAYHPQYPFVGILWHPEREKNIHEFNDQLVSAFLKRQLFWQK